MESIDIALRNEALLLEKDRKTNNLALKAVQTEMARSLKGGLGKEIADEIEKRENPSILQRINAWIKNFLIMLK